MSLFYVSVFKKNATDDANPIWENSIDAFDVEEAYRIGKSQFIAENPDKSLEDFKIKASGYQVEK
jgi:hypothetical protein